MLTATSDVYPIAVASRRAAREAASGAALLAALLCGLLFTPLGTAQTTQISERMAQLAEQRRSLAEQLDQYEITLRLLAVNEPNPDRSDNPTIRKLADEVADLQRQISVISQRELTLSQQHGHAIDVAKPNEPDSFVPATAKAPDAIEAAPADQQPDDVSRLLALLSTHRDTFEKSPDILPAAGELALGHALEQNAQTQAKTPFNVDKVRLNGLEASTSLALMTARLWDSSVSEDRHRRVLICSIKTRQSNALVESESLSLRPIGKNQYIAKISLLAGDSTFHVAGHEWLVKLPADMPRSDHVVTLYSPPSGKPEFHLFSVHDLLAEEKPYLPSWVSSSIDLKPGSE